MFAFVADPENLPHWSFVDSIEKQEDLWVVTTRETKISIRFVADERLGVLDHFVRVSPEQ